MTSSPGFFRRLIDVRDGEFMRLLVMSTYLLLIIASYTASKAVRDSLFVTGIGPSQLPYVYLLIAVVTGVISYGYSRAVNRIGLYSLVRLTSIVAISNLLVFWWILKTESSLWFYVLYVWVSVFGVITASQFWLLATHVFDPREARRIFAWIGVGGILGGMLGGGLTKIVAMGYGTESLLLLCAAMMFLTLVLLERVVHLGNASPVERSESSRSDEVEKEDGVTTAFQQVRKSRHLTMLMVLLSLSVIVEAFVDYEYKFVARGSFTSKDHLTAFFGTMSFYIGVFSLLFQMLLTSRILKRFGVRAIVLLPVGLLVASVVVALKPVLWSVALLQLIDGGFSYSIHRSGMELLYLPVPSQTRNAVKGFIDMFVDRLGRAVGGLLLLLLTMVLTVSIPMLSIVVIGLLVGWIVIATLAKGEYLNSFSVVLEKKTIEPETLRLSVRDSPTFAALLVALSSTEEREVLYALDLLGNTHPKHWRDHVPALIRHPSRDVRIRTLAALSQWNDSWLKSDEFIHHPDSETARAAAAAALSLEWTGSRPSCESLERLLQDPSPEVVRQAIRTAGNVRYCQAMPALIARLADKRLRRDAREALLKCGDDIIPELLRRLLDDAELRAVRIRIPKVLAYTGKQSTAAALLGCLDRLPPDLNYRALKALNRLRTSRPEIRLNREIVGFEIRKELDEYDRLGGIRAYLRRNPMEDFENSANGSSAAYSILLQALQERLDFRLERLFRLMALIYPPHDIYSAYYSLKGKPHLRASAIEFLDNLLEPEFKQTIVSLVEDGLTSESGREEMDFISREAALQALINGFDPWLQTIAADVANRLRAQGEAFHDEEHRVSDGRR